MAKVTLILTDDPDGGLSTEWTIDPPITDWATSTQAQKAAVYLHEFMASGGRTVGPAVDLDAAPPSGGDQ
jgi:hypothetical protein